MGNIHSVTKSLESLGEEILLIKNFKESKSCKAIILPGVGAFDPAMVNLIKTDLITDLKHWINSGKSFLGICLGLQLLFESSDEGKVQGLGILKGKIKKIPNVASQYGIRSIPTLMIFKGGQKVDTVVGAVPKATLSSTLTKHL